MKDASRAHCLPGCGKREITGRHGPPALQKQPAAVDPRAGHGRLHVPEPRQIRSGPIPPGRGVSPCMGIRPVSPDRQP